MRTSRIAAFFTVAALAVAPLAHAKLGNASGASANFHASGPAGLAIDGKTSDVTVADDGANVMVTVKLAAIDTGVGLRNDHTKKALETDKFPDAMLTVPRAALKFPADGASSEGDAKGSLKIHGTPKDVTFHYKASKKGAAITVEGSTRVNVDEFGIKRPSYLGVTVKQDVDLKVTFTAQDA
jgi:polyisoprenoid-binding protein YceI